MKRAAAILAMIIFTSEMVLPRQCGRLRTEEPGQKNNAAIEQRTHLYTVNGGPAHYPTSYEIPFSSRQDFESAWPYLLKVKTEGAPVILISGSAKHAFVSHDSKTGVIVRYPHSRGLQEGTSFTLFPSDPAKLAAAMPPDPFNSDGPIPAKKARDRWYRTTYIRVGRRWRRRRFKSNSAPGRHSDCRPAV